MTRTGSLCSGYGGLDMAVEAVFDAELAWVADNNPGASAILTHRFPAAKNLGNIAEANWGTVDPVDVMCMGFPCKNVSCAGDRTGLQPGNQSGVWTHCARGISELRPSLVIIENVRGLLSAPANSDMEPCPWCLGNAGSKPALRALGAVLGDLADLGFDAEWFGLPASDPGVGACHERWREFVIAWPAAENPHRPAWQQWWPAAPRQTEGWRPRPDTGGRGGFPAAPTRGLNLLPTPAARDWKSGASNLMDRNSRPLNEYAVNMLAGIRQPDGQWVAADGTDYGPAIRRWEGVLGRSAPCPTEPGIRGNRRLSALFVEWMMGLPAGWVTGVPELSRNDQLTALGNGCVPQQVTAALETLLTKMPQLKAVA